MTQKLPKNLMMIPYTKRYGNKSEIGDVFSQTIAGVFWHQCKTRQIILAIVLIVLALLSMTFLKAQQVPIVRIDPHSRVGVQTAPFDHTFYLLLPVDTTLQLDELKQVNLYKIPRKYTRGYARKKMDSPKAMPKIKYYDAEYLKKAWFVDTPKEASFKYLKIYIDTQLLPNTHFSVILVQKASHDYLDQLNEINENLYNGDIALSEQEYLKITSGLKIKYSSNEEAWPSFDSYKLFFQDSLMSLYHEIALMDTAISNNLDKLRDSLISAGFHISQLLEYNRRKELMSKEIFSDSTKFLVPLINLLNVDSTAIPSFAAGKLNIQQFEPYQMAKDNEIQKRVDNYERLKVAITNISYFFHFSSFAPSIHAPTGISIYSSVINALKAIDKRIMVLKNTFTKIRGQINGQQRLFSAELAYGGTTPNGEDLQTSSGHYIIADLGIANVGTFVNNRFGYIARPYLGVNFSFIAIDKSQPLINIENKRFLHKLSAVIGLTTVSLSQQGTYDLISNMSVVTGLAYRISRGVRFTFGVLVYKVDNANPVLPQKVTVGPMAALSLDLDIAKWFNDLKSKVY